jgi:phenylacetate-CoA ligase
MMHELSAKLHDALATRILVPALRWQQVVRPDKRPFMFAYREARRFRQSTIGWSEEVKRDWILTRLRLQLRRAYAETSYYHELFGRIGFDPRADFSFADFAQLPPLERNDIHKAGDALVSSIIPAHQLRKNATGGSTGVPTEVWMGPEESAWSDSGREHFVSLIGLPPGTRTGMFWGHHLDPVASDRIFDRLVAFTYNLRWLDCFRLSAEKLEAVHREFTRQRPACVIAYASALGHLAEHILERGYRPAYPTRCFITGAEKLIPEHRELIERAFARPVHERYGSRDVGSIGFQLRPQESPCYTIDWANLLVEPESDEADSAILITKLHADGMPMIRYRIDDLGRFPEGSHPGHPALSLSAVLGRRIDRVWLRDGRWIHGIQLPHLMKDFPVREFMFVQYSDYSVEVKIAPKPEFNDDSRRLIQAAITANLPGLDVRVVIVDAIPRTRASKWRPVISEVQVAEG